MCCILSPMNVERKYFKFVQAGKGEFSYRLNTRQYKTSSRDIIVKEYLTLNRNLIANTISRHLSANDRILLNKVLLSSREKSGFSGVDVVRCLLFCVMFSRSLFILLSISLGPLYILSVLQFTPFDVVKKTTLENINSISGRGWYTGIKIKSNVVNLDSQD